MEEPDTNGDGEKAFQASASVLQSDEPDPELDQEFVDALAASEDADEGQTCREQLLARIARSTCRACGERGHWKAECPKLGRGSSSSKEATTTVAQVDADEAMAADHDQGLEVHAFVAIQESHVCEIKERLRED